MAYDSPNALNAKLNYYKTNATALHLLNNFDPTESLAANLARSIVNYTVSSGDLVITTVNVNEKRLTIAAQSGNLATQTITGTKDLSFVLVSGSELLCQFDETTDADIGLGSSVPFPALVTTAKQPVDV